MCALCSGGTAAALLLIWQIDIIDIISSYLVPKEEAY